MVHVLRSLISLFSMKELINVIIVDCYGTYYGHSAVAKLKQNFGCFEGAFIFAGELAPAICLSLEEMAYYRICYFKACLI